MSTALIAVDWGTSHLRAWALGAGGEVLARTASDDGMARMTPGSFEPALLALVSDWLDPEGRTPVMVCGMAGSRQGWAEAAYRTVPCTPLAQGDFTEAATRDPRLRVFILPGLNQLRPADVMRGEETQIAGLLESRPAFDGVVCLPGTHTKWARVSAGEVVSFQTFMTGELFELLASHSVLRHSVADTGWQAEGFEAAVDDQLSHPDRLTARLFQLRAESLLDGLPPDVARARLSGLLVGAELAGARPYWLGQKVVVIGSAAISRAYVTALARHGSAPEAESGEAMVLAGLAAAHRRRS